MEINRWSMGGLCAVTVAALLVSSLGAASATEVQSGQQSNEPGIEVEDNAQPEELPKVISDDEVTVEVEESRDLTEEQLSDLPEGFVPDPLELTENIPDQEELPTFYENFGGIRGRAADDGFVAPISIGQGWSGITPVYAGNADGKGVHDIYGITKSGDLFFYPRYASGWDHAGKKVVGKGGWNSMKNVTGGFDITGDKIPDIIGVDTSGNLRVYRGLGDGRVSFSHNIATGWQNMKKIALASNGPNKKPVIYAIASDGRLNQYLTDGKGKIIKTNRLGPNWENMRQIIGVNDWDGNGYSELIAVTSNGDMRIYKGTSAEASFLQPVKIGIGWHNMAAVINGVNTNTKQAIWAVDSKGVLWEYSKTPRGSGSSNIVNIARKYFGVPYVWGGSDPSGFDCSGLVSYIYREAGKPFSPWRLNTTGITNQARQISASQAQPGDILSWPGHVAIYVSPGVMIDAPKPGYTVGQRAIWGSPTYYRFP